MMKWVRVSNPVKIKNEQGVPVARTNVTVYEYINGNEYSWVCSVSTENPRIIERFVGNTTYQDIVGTLEFAKDMTVSAEHFPDLLIDVPFMGKTGVIVDMGKK